MKDCTFDLIKGQAEGERPLILEDAYQVIECTWMEELENGFESKEHIGQLEGVEGPYKDFNGITSKFGCHFILKIDNILMEEKYADNLRNGLKRNSFPSTVITILKTSGIRSFLNLDSNRLRLAIADLLIALCTALKD